MILKNGELLRIINAKYIKEYSIKIEFNTGEKKLINLEKELYGTIFEPLKNVRKFKKFFVSSNTIEWENGADFAPEFLYAHSIKI